MEGCENFPKILELLKFQAEQRWHEASSLVMIHKYYVLTYKI